MTDKKYHTAADALYGLREWASEKEKEHRQGIKILTSASDDNAYSWAFGKVTSEIDKALQDVFGNFQKGHRLHDPWDGETWTFFSPSGKGAIVMRCGQDDLEFPDIDVLDIADQLLYDMQFATGIGHTWKTEYETPDGQSVVIAEGVGGHLKTYHQLAAALAHVAKRGGAA